MNVVILTYRLSIFLIHLIIVKIHYLLLHVNMRSLNKHQNFDALYEFLILLSFSPDVICISETRLRGDSLTNITIPNYNFVHADSITNVGGVAIYISSNYNFELDPELDMKVNVCEELWLNLKTGTISSKHITIGAVYRHPNNNSNYIKNFTGALVNTISKINKRKGTFYLLGDFNIDITINKRTSSSLLFLDHLISCYSLPIITIPTRVTKISSTIIDHIITNNTSHIINPGVIRCDSKLSDHYVIFCTINNYPTKPLNKTFYTIRDKSKLNTEVYCNEMHESVYNFITNINELMILTLIVRLITLCR